MATVVYPQMITKENPLKGLGQGLSALGNVLGSVIAQRQDKTLLNLHLEQAQAQLQTGDPSGMVGLLSQVKTPQYKQMLTTQLQYGPQALYRQNDQGQVESAGILPGGGKLLDPDRQGQILQRQLQMEQLKGQNKEKLEALKTDRMEKRLEAQHKFQEYLQDKRFMWQENLQNLREAGKSKEDLRTQGRLLLKDYAANVAKAKLDAQKQKQSLKGLETTNPEQYAAQVQEIDEDLKSYIGELNTTYGTLAPDYGYKLPNIVKSKSKGISDDEIYSALNPGARSGKMSYPRTLKNPDTGETVTVKSKEEYDKYMGGQ